MAQTAVKTMTKVFSQHYSALKPKCAIVQIMFTSPKPVKITESRLSAPLNWKTFLYCFHKFDCIFGFLKQCMSDIKSPYYGLWLDFWFKIPSVYTHHWKYCHLSRVGLICVDSYFPLWLFSKSAKVMTFGHFLLKTCVTWRFRHKTFTNNSNNNIRSERNWHMSYIQKIDPGQSVITEAYYCMLP